MCQAAVDDGVWRVSAPEPVGDTHTFFQRHSLKRRALFGFDFPIGLPEFYAERAGFKDYRTAMKTLATPEWRGWFEVCETAEEISLMRPFYPFNSGKKKGDRQRSHLINAHKATDYNALRRLSENESNACSMFWTLGGNQVGKGMIAGWQELLLYNLDAVALWPFDGDLMSLSAQDKPVVCETYPGMAYAMIGLDMQEKSKRRQADRQSQAQHFFDWQKSRAVAFDETLTALIGNGFGEHSHGEDMFDATIGLMLMLDVVTGRVPEMRYLSKSTLEIEGWILGLV